MNTLDRVISGDMQRIKHAARITPKPTRFNFTHAIPGGAWIDGAAGVQWLPFATLRARHGQAWIDAQLRKQGMFTGCWIDVVQS